MDSQKKMDIVEPLYSRDWLKTVIKFLLSSKPNGLSIPELERIFEYKYFMPLPLLNNPNNRLMLESFSDILVVRNERVYPIRQNPDGGSVKFDSPLAPSASHSRNEDKSDEIELSREWIGFAINFLLSSKPNGLTLEELNDLFQKEHWMPLPLLGFSTHRLMLESFSNLLVIRDERVYSIGLDPNESNVKANEITKKWTRNALQFMLSPMENGIDIDDLRTEFPEMFGIPLPTLEFPTDRLMIKSFCDILEVRGDRVHAINQFYPTNDPEIQGESDDDDNMDQGEPKPLPFKMASQSELYGDQTCSVGHDGANPDGELLVMATADVDEAHPVEEPFVFTSRSEGYRLTIPFIRSIILDIVVSSVVPITVPQLMATFRQLVGVDLPSFHFATHRLMLEAMNDLFVLVGDYIYLAGGAAASRPVA